MPALELWDCSLGRELADHDGVRVDARELHELCRIRAERMGLSAGAWPSGAVRDFDPLARVRPARWEHGLAQAIFVLSGQLARRDELLQGRALLDALPRAVRAEITTSHVLGLLAPLLVGFRTARGVGFVDEANRIGDAAAVLRRLLEPAVLGLDIPLCAHRDARAGLAPAPCSRAITRVCALLRTLAAGSACARFDVRMLQQGPSERAAACMFPAVFLEYAAGDRTDELLGLLDDHERLLSTQLARESSARVRLSSASLDPLSDAAERDLVELHGPGWQTIDSAWASPWAEGELGRAMLGSAIDHVARLMPEVGRLPALRFRTGSAAARAAVEWFVRRAQMSVHGRALFEVAFYRRWAARARACNAIGIGLDRDFAPFQRMAWQLAHGAELEGAVPLVYARRTETPRAGGSLRQLGFRQLWQADAPKAAA